MLKMKGAEILVFIHLEWKAWRVSISHPPVSTIQFLKVDYTATPVSVLSFGNMEPLEHA